MSPRDSPHSDDTSGRGFGLEEMPSPATYMGSPSPARFCNSISSSPLVSSSPLLMVGSPMRKPRVAMAASPVSYGSPVKSPTKWSAQAQSPGGAIRRNAASFGIPLHLSTNDVALPVPVRSVSNGQTIIAPSPMRRGVAAPPSFFLSQGLTTHSETEPDTSATIRATARPFGHRRGGA